VVKGNKNVTEPTGGSRGPRQLGCRKKDHKKNKRTNCKGGREGQVLGGGVLFGERRIALKRRGSGKQERSNTQGGREDRGMVVLKRESVFSHFLDDGLQEHTGLTDKIGGKGKRGKRKKHNIFEISALGKEAKEHTQWGCDFSKEKYKEHKGQKEKGHVEGGRGM